MLGPIEAEIKKRLASARTSNKPYQDKFPPDQFAWFDDDLNAEMYACNDARHMPLQSAARFSEKLINMEEGLNANDD